LGWAFVVSDGASVTSYRSHYKAVMVLPPCLIFFLITPILREGIPVGVDDGTVVWGAGKFP